VIPHSLAGFVISSVHMFDYITGELVYIVCILLVTGHHYCCDIYRCSRFVYVVRVDLGKATIWYCCSSFVFSYLCGICALNNYINCLQVISHLFMAWLYAIFSRP